MKKFALLGYSCKKLVTMSTKKATGISETQVRYIADLARLELSGDEIRKLTQELGNILHYIERLNELDTSGVEPTYSSLGGASRVREDVVIPSMPREALLRGAPLHDDESVLVPVVITAG